MQYIDDMDMHDWLKCIPIIKTKSEYNNFKEHIEQQKETANDIGEEFFQGPGGLGESLYLEVGQNIVNFYKNKYNKERI